MSPIKRVISGSGIPLSDDMQRQAGGGVIRKGGVESRLDVVTIDIVPRAKSEGKRSRSTPATVGVSGRLEGRCSHSYRAETIETDS